VSAAQPKYREKAHAARTLKIDGDALIDTATVESTDNARRLGLALHLQGKPQLSASFAADADFAKDRPDSFRQWRNVTVATFQDQAEFDVEYRGRVMHVTLSTPGEFKLWHGSAPDVPPRRRDSFFLELTTPAKSATFVTRIAPKAP
jgi:hypothetical protein